MHDLDYDKEKYDTTSFCEKVSNQDPFIFDTDYGSHKNVLSCFKAINFITLFLKDDLLSIIANEINKYAKEKCRIFVDTSIQELKTFGLCIQIEFVKMASLRNYLIYLSSRIMLCGTIIAARITRDKF